MPEASASVDHPPSTPNLPHGERIAAALRDLLPHDGAVAACWHDWVLGNGAVAVPGNAVELRYRAERALADPAATIDDGGSLTLVCDSTDGSARMALAAMLPGADAPQRQVWMKQARSLLEATLEAGRAQVRIVSLEKAKRLQQALYEIADLAGADLEMTEMLRRVHAVIDTLMYARNCYIVLYDDQRNSVRFLYFADCMDPWVTEPERDFTEEDMPNSMTFGLLHHGQAIRGPSMQVRQSLGVVRDLRHGPDSQDWMGVPMRRGDRVRGAIVVQSYDTPASYSDEDRALLGYVAQHILTALERRQSLLDMERHIEVRTRELQSINAELQAEIAERKRAETLQQALFRITELAMTSASLEGFYADVHGVVAGLLPARNFYIALLSDDGNTLEFPYIVDENTSRPHSRRRGKGLTEYVIDTERPLLADRAALDALAAQGALREFGPRSNSWLGVPLSNDGYVFGAVVVQSYSAGIGFNAEDQNLLTFVAHHIGNGLARQRAQQRLLAAHAELERRVDERTHALAAANANLTTQIGERLRAEQRLIHQATHDSLTGLPNRACLLECLATAIKQADMDDGRCFAVLFLDLDRFKLVNDSIGHVAGDALLVEVARRIADAVGPGDLVARLGGDEFAVLADCREGESVVHELAQRLLSVLNQPAWVAGRELFPSISIGIAIWHPRYCNGEELLRDADAAMYRAKSQGRDRYEVFDEAMREAALRALDLDADLRRAINNRDFVAHYQPIVRLHDGEIVGHEALLRWDHERRGLLLPGEFIGLGEEDGLIEQVDWQLYAQAAERIARGGRGYVAVNVSPRHFRSPDFAERLLEVCEAAGADPARLRLEITEVALLDDAPRALHSLRLLRQHGVLAFLDDFGTGFSALSYLHRFPISALKIDRSFIAGIDDKDRPESLALVRAILALAGTLGIETVAEGVETPMQWQLLRGLGCTYAQGYLIGQPTIVPREATGMAAEVARRCSSQSVF
ncbi:MAG: EAL domain-containing protein [Pseudoxanthomonas sp.]